MSVSIREVASRAGVSRSTVSKVLSGSRDSIGSGTQERVRRAAAELGYRPHAVARSLRRRRTDILGLYSGHGNPWWLAEDIQRACERHRKDLLIHGAFRNNSVDDLAAELASGHIDGLLLVSALHDPLAERLASSSRPGARLPAVAIADAAPGIPSVVADDRAAGRLMAEHLAGRGHRRVLYRDADFPRVSTVRRAEAFRERARELGVAVTALATPEDVGRQLSDEEAGLLTGGPERHTAVACFSDDATLPVLHAAGRLGLRIPEDLAVIGAGMGGVDSATLLRPTFVRIPWGEVAQRAVDVLITIIDGKEVSQETVIPVELVPGDTT